MLLPQRTRWQMFNTLRGLLYETPDMNIYVYIEYRGSGGGGDIKGQVYPAKSGWPIGWNIMFAKGLQPVLVLDTQYRH